MSTSLWSIVTLSSRRPTPQQIDDCIALLRREGAIGPTVDGQPMRWTVGPDLAGKLGMHFTGETVELSWSDQLQVIMGDCRITCRACGSDVEAERWQSLVEQYISTMIEPGYLCHSCGVITPLESLRYDPEAAFTFCSLNFPESAEPDKSSPLWRGLESIFGSLKAVWVHL
jgi:hypothetical protein